MNIAIAASGRKTVTCGAYAARNAPGQLLVLSGGRHYRGEVEASPLIPSVALKLQFRPDLLAEAFLELSEAGGLPPAPAPATGPLFTGPMEPELSSVVERLLDCLTVEDLARAANMSPSHFAHRFREVMPLSPIQYLKQARLRRARLALLAGTPVGRLAHELGYQSASHFSRDFRRQFGLAPALYARSLAAVSQDRADTAQVQASA